VGGGWLGGGEIESKAKLSSAEAGVWAELGNTNRLVASINIFKLFKFFQINPHNYS
jgi:hypothetical protein